MGILDDFQQAIMKAERPELEWIPTAEVREGDRLAMLLSDAQAFPEVTGWADREIDLTRHGLGVHVHRTFTVTPVEWWYGPHHADMRTSDLAGQALIVKRGA